MSREEAREGVSAQQTVLPLSLAPPWGLRTFTPQRALAGGQEWPGWDRQALLWAEHPQITLREHGSCCRSTCEDRARSHHTQLDPRDAGVSWLAGPER